MNSRVWVLILALSALFPAQANAEGGSPPEEPSELSLPQEALLMDLTDADGPEQPPAREDTTAEEASTPKSAPADTLTPPADAEEWKRAVRLGISSSQKNDLDGAIEAYSHAIQLNPNDAMIHYARAGVHARRGDVGAQIKDLDRAIEIFKDMRFYYERGLAHSGQKRWKEAIEDLSKTIELYPGHAGAYRARANAKGEMGDLRGKREDLEFARKLLPESAAPAVPSDSFGQRTGSV